ncbi:MAG: MnhB domain-containing protein [Mycobacteriales bacterium]
MSRRARLLLFAASGAGLVTLIVTAYLGLPAFGRISHPYGARAISAAVVDKGTANVVASVTFDQRGFDTLGEEFILFTSVLGALLLLRPSAEETKRARNAPQGRVLDSTRLVAHLLLPLTLLIGVYVVAHGNVTPGGGFQGGVILATALHLLYLGGDYATLRRFTPRAVFDVVESVGAAGYLVLGLAGLIAGGAFLDNVLPRGTFGQLTSAGTVPLLNVAVGMEVFAGIVLLLARFFEQDLELRGGDR